MNRVVVTNPIMGVCHMQVCVVEDATDEEILAACNRENVAGTRNGWTTVMRGKGNPSAPVRCDQHAERFHLLVRC